MRYLLFPFSILYRFLVGIRNLAYSSGLYKIHRLSKPVLAIGNISTGGTGKTPIATYLLDYFSQQGKKAAYLSRGYGRDSSGFKLVVPGKKNAAILYGDEASQVGHNFPNMPIAVCVDRVYGGQKLIDDYQAELLILDDAFQHRRIYRDLNILVIDATKLPDEDFMLPAGNLREPRSAVSKADFIIFNRLKDQKQLDELKELYPAQEKAFCRPMPKSLQKFSENAEKLPSLSDSNIIAFSAIGNNTAFQNMLEARGATLLKSFSYRDHHVIKASEMALIVKEWSNQKESGVDSIILTTEKDYYRIKDLEWIDQYNSKPLFYLPIELEWLEGESLLQKRINEEIQ